MRHIGFTAIALTVTMTVACGGGTRENRDNDEAIVGTSGEDAPRGVARFSMMSLRATPPRSN